MPTVKATGRWSGESLIFRHGQTGERIPVWYDLFRVDDPLTGQPVNLATITRDITEQKRSEEALREARARLASTLTAAEVGTFHWDVEKDSLVGDLNFLRIFGVPGVQEGAPLAAYVDRIHADDQASVTAAIRKTVSEGGPYSEEYRVIHPDAGNALGACARRGAGE